MTKHTGNRAHTSRSPHSLCCQVSFGSGGGGGGGGGVAWLDTPRELGCRPSRGAVRFKSQGTTLVLDDSLGHYTTC